MNALAGNNISESKLPGPKEEVIALFSNPPENINTKEKIINYSLATWKLLNGSKAPFDETYWRALITKHYDRIQDHLSQYNHGRACFASPEDRTTKLGQVKTPTLVIHGTEDPMLPVEHGKTLAKAIPGAQLKIIKKMGHALNPLFHQEIIESIINHANEYKR